MIRRGRPGLIGTMARTAVVTGTATSVHNRMTRRANERAYQDAQAAGMVQAPPAGGGQVGQLNELADMKAKGLLTDEEFVAAKAKLLSG